MQDDAPGCATLRAQQELAQSSSTWTWLEEFKVYAMFYTEVLGHDEVFGEVVDWRLASPFDYNCRSSPCFDLPQVEGGIVFRALRVDECTDLGLEPKLPNLYGKLYEDERYPGRKCRGVSYITMDEHIQSGSGMAESLYISTSRCPIAALFYAMKSYVHHHHDPEELMVAGINLGPMGKFGGVREHTFIYDMSTLMGRDSFLRTYKACNYARKFDEVLLEGVVPPSAVAGRMSLSTICDLVRNPQLLEQLRQSTLLGFDCFYDSCKGPVENAILRHHGLPIPASVQPERPLFVTPVQARRPIPAKYPQACRICGSWISPGHPIINVAPRGWVHASCACVQDAPLRQATRRGGMQKRLSARSAATTRDIVRGDEDIASIPGTHDSWL